MQLSEQDIIKVIEANKGLLFKVAHQYCRDSNDREDLVQEMVIAVWKSASRYDPDYKISTWMTRIAINIAVSHYRKNRKYSQKTEAIEDHTSIAAPDSFEDTEQNHLLKQVLQEETPLNRALVILYLEGHNQKEIADILGISSSNVASKLHRLKTKFTQQHSQEKQTAQG